MRSNTDFKPVRKAVFPVAGLGTRFLPATKVMPKEMLPLNGKPLIQHAIEEAKEAGIEEFVFITGRHKEMLEEHFDFQPELESVLESRGKTELLDLVRSTEIDAGKLFLTRQPKALGLGHAIWCAKELVGDEPFAVILPDDVFLSQKGCLAQMVEAYNSAGGNMMAVKQVSYEDTARYGIVDTDDNQQNRTVDVKNLVEKPAPEDAPSQLAIMGRYILQPEIFDYLSAFEKGAGGEIQLTDAMCKLIGKQPFHGFRYDGERYDCGTILGFIESNAAYGLADPVHGPRVREILEGLLRNTKETEKSNEAA